MEKIVEFIKGLRKWSIMIIVIIVAIIFRVKDLLSGIEFVALVKGIGVAFMSSNAIEHVKDAIIKKPKPQITKKEDMSED